MGKGPLQALIPLKKKWVCHPIKDDDEILDLAAEAGCWYVYQAIFDTSDHIRNRVKRLQERGIGVEGTIILGTDEQDEDYIKRLVDFLLEIKLDLAEFTILTPFPHTPIRESLQQEGRILSNDWRNYTGGKVVYQPAKMSPEKLQDLYYYAWDTFYKESSQNLRMAKLFMKVIEKEKADGTYQGASLRRAGNGRRTRPWRTCDEDPADISERHDVAVPHLSPGRQHDRVRSHARGPRGAAGRLPVPEDVPRSDRAGGSGLPARPGRDLGPEHRQREPDERAVLYPEREEHREPGARGLAREGDARAAPGSRSSRN